MALFLSVITYEFRCTLQEPFRHIAPLLKPYSMLVTPCHSFSTTGGNCIINLTKFVCSTIRHVKTIYFYMVNRSSESLDRWNACDNTTILDQNYQFRSIWKKSQAL